MGLEHFMALLQASKYYVTCWQEMSATSHGVGCHSASSNVWSYMTAVLVRHLQHPETHAPFTCSISLKLAKSGWSWYPALRHSATVEPCHTTTVK